MFLIVIISIMEKTSFHGEQSTIFKHFSITIWFQRCPIGGRRSHENRRSSYFDILLDVGFSTVGQISLLEDFFDLNHCHEPTDVSWSGSRTVALLE